VWARLTMGCGAQVYEMDFFELVLNPKSATQVRNRSSHRTGPDQPSVLCGQYRSMSVFEWGRELRGVAGVVGCGAQSVENIFDLSFVNKKGTAELAIGEVSTPCHSHHGSSSYGEDMLPLWW
jgi:hypothetical protein